MPVQERTRTTITPIPTEPTGPGENIPRTPPPGGPTPTRTRTTPRRRVALVAVAAVAVVLAAAGLGQLLDSGSSADPAVAGRAGFSVIGGEPSQVPALAGVAPRFGVIGGESSQVPEAARLDRAPRFSIIGGEYTQVPTVARLQGLADYREARASER